MVTLEQPSNGPVGQGPEQEGWSAPAHDPAPAYGAFTPVDAYDPPIRKKQSGLGIASFAIFGSMTVIFIIVLAALAMKIAGLIDLTTGTADMEELERRISDMPELALLGLALLGTLLGNLVGLILGIIGLVQKDRKKVFAVLGTVLNGLVIAGLALLMLVSVLAAAAAA